MGRANKAFPYCGCGAEAENTWQCGAGTERSEYHSRPSADDQLSQLGCNGTILSALSAG